MSSQHEISPRSGESQHDEAQGRKKRVRSWTPYDRAKHRVVERNRREAFGESLTALARAVPGLAEVKESKLSKHLVVEESLAYHREQQSHNDELERTLQAVAAERDVFLQELNEWRQCLGMPLRQSTVMHLSTPSREETSLAEHQGPALDPLAAFNEYQANLAFEGAAGPAPGPSFVSDTLGLSTMVLPGGDPSSESMNAMHQPMQIPAMHYDTSVRQYRTEDWMLGLNAG